MCVCSFLYECILLYWRTSENFTKQVPADRHTHALFMHGLFKVYNMCAFQMGMLPTWTKTMIPKRNPLGIMNVELSPVPVRHLFSPVSHLGSMWILLDIVCSYVLQEEKLVIYLGFGCFKQMNIIFQNNLCDSLASFPISSHIHFHRVVIIVIYIEMLAM